MSGQVYTSAEEYYFLDACDTSKSNWMRYVNPAYSPDAQNLVAVQHEVSRKLRISTGKAVSGEATELAQMSQFTL